MGAPVFNTTCDLFRGATGPGTPTISAIDIRLVPLGFQPENILLIGLLTPPSQAAVLILVTHYALFSDETDIQDTWDPLAGWAATSDHIWVPNDDGVCYTVLFVDMIRDTKTGTRMRRAWLMRQRVNLGGLGLGWPQQGI